MKKSLLTAVAVAGLFATAAEAAPAAKQAAAPAPAEKTAAVTPYVSAKLARSWDKIKFKGDENSASLLTWGGDIAVGAKMGDTRAELEYGFTKMGTKSDIDG